MYNALILFCTYFSLGTLLMCVDSLISRVKWLSERNRQKRVNEYRAAAYAKHRQLRVIKGNRESLWADISKE
jgi:hypothetical protein